MIARGGAHDRFVKPTDTHQILDPNYSHPYHCKKGISYRTCSDNNIFNKSCKDLERWLMRMRYNEK